MTPKNDSVRIAVVLSSAFSTFRQACMGVADFAQTQPDWVLRLVVLEHRRNPSIRKWRPHGIVGVFSDPSTMKWVRKVGASLGIPAVTTIHEWPDSGMPQVLFDEEAIGSMAAKHLLDRGFRQLAYLGHGKALHAQQRESGFAREALRAGVTPHRFATPMPNRYIPADAGVRNWLRSLPKPVGLMAVGDIYGAYTVEICHELGFRVPEDVAVIGVDNNDLRCCLSHPPLSSVMVPARDAGFEAARLLERLIRGRTHPAQSLRLPPAGIVMRASTDIIAYDDIALATALRLMQDSARQDINVNEVLSHVSVGRRTLFRKFKAALGRTPFEEIHRLRLQRACGLLETTNLPLGKIAARSGYRTRRRMLAAFRKRLALTPDEYRRERRGREMRRQASA